MSKLCAGPFETSTSRPQSGQGPGIWTFDDWIVQIPGPSGQNGVQIPHLIVGFVCQMPLLKNSRRRLLSCVHLRYAETLSQFRCWQRSTRIRVLSFEPIARHRYRKRLFYRSFIINSIRTRVANAFLQFSHAGKLYIPALS